MHTRAPYLFASLIAATLVAAPAAAQQNEFSWHGTMTAGQTLEIRGISGDIDATLAPGSEARVTADKHARRSNPADVKIVAVPHSGGVTICALYPAPSGRPENTCEPGGGRNNSRNNDTEVDFTVHVPAGVQFSAHNVNGDVTANGLRGDVDAQTVNGGITVSTSGVVNATTVNGGITADMGSAAWTGDLALKTVNGGIRVTLPADVNAEVSASTVNGGLSTDFPLTVQGRFNPRHIQGVIGKGGRKLSVQTVNGGIDLRRR
jgi:DUF4097 and DUF4098 domain-containing protein YvlB